MKSVVLCRADYRTATIVPLVRTEQAKSKISYNGASLFDYLPSELVDIENHSINCYKKKLKTFRTLEC